VLTFSDEFDGSAVDADKWSSGFGWGDTAGNFAAWCDPAANAVVDGVLVQRADRLAAPQHGKAYSGACLHTKATFSQLYGYWEARMKVAAGPGVHSALWGKPASEAWPPTTSAAVAAWASPWASDAPTSTRLRATRSESTPPASSTATLAAWRVASTIPRSVTVPASSTAKVRAIIPIASPRDVTNVAANSSR
jgi:hypothetical protein